MRAATHHIPARTRFRGHSHDTPHLVAVLSGGFLEREGKSTRDVGLWALRLSSAGTHDIDFGPDGAHCLLLELSPEDVTSPPESPVFLESDDWLGRILQRVSSAVSARAADADALVIELLAQIERRRLLSPRRAPRPPGWLLAVRDRVHDEASPPPLATLACEAGVHRVHLARAFRDHFGETLGDYARRRRLDRALALLADGSLPLSQVAQQAGYADQSHLTRAVRRAFGTTPARLRGRTLPRFNTGPLSAR